MRSLRIGFALLALVLAVPVALLVERALDSVGFERQVRHDVVAERVFDEIERELSSLLEREEQRPFADYTGGAGLPAEDWLIGYFQVDPDGRLHTPHPVAAEAQRRLRETVGRYWSGATAEKRLQPESRDEQRAGTTVELKPRRSLMKEKSDAFSAYDALSSLNRGVRQRQERKTRVLEEQALASEGFADAKLEAAESEPEADRPYGAASSPPARSDAPGRPGEARAPASGRIAQDLRASGAAPAIRTALDPMTGRALDASHLVLFRTVVRGSRGYRQGLLIDFPRFGEWLAERAVGSSGLGGRAGLRFATALDADPDPDPGAAAAYVYRRRFAEPFGDVHATLELEPLPGLGGGGYVLALSVLLVGAGALGLVALYRMVAVALRFAERRSNFAAAVSHELKTPLTAIRMYAEMLRDGMVESDEKRDEYHEAITAESERLSRLIHNVLEFSQLEKGTRELALEVGPVEPVVRDTERLLRAHVEREGFALEVEIEAGLPSIRFDRDALVQVLFNLVDNALKYAAAAEDRRVCLRCEPEADRDGVRILVRDFGPGVPPRQLSRVFEPFYRAEAELTRRARGTGIGLALVRGLCEAMGARVDARNAEPGGLLVTLRFGAA